METTKKAEPIRWGEQLWASVAATVVLLIICCGLYPLIVWVVAQGVFRQQANGSLLKRDGSPTTDDRQAAGSALLGQSFSAAGYFHPRPSAAGNGYDATSSGGTNLGPLSDKLLNGTIKTTPPTTTQPAVDSVDFDGIRLRTIHYAFENGLPFKLMQSGVEVPLKHFQAADGTLDDVALIKAFPHNGADGLVAGDFRSPDGAPLLVPADAVTASASGLDPHISPANAALQATRVATARKAELKKVQALVNQCTDRADFGFLGDPGVNVLRLNLALDTQFPVPTSTAGNGPSESGSGPVAPVAANRIANPGTGLGGGTGTTKAAAATTTASPADADAGRRNLPPAPIDSPPFPGSDWTGPDILVGTGDGTPQSRIEAFLKDTNLGKALADQHIRLYGWADLGANLSSSNHSNAPSGYDLVPDFVDLNQLVLRIERVPDTSQANHSDWGFRVTQLFGTDYRYTTAQGFLSGQLLRNNRLYGYDVPELYAVMYLPHVADGMVVKLGRFLSPPDIESALAPNNYMYSHSLLFVADPVTFTGVNTITKLNRHLSAELGVTAGADMTPFVHSASTNAHAMLSYRTDSGNDSVYGGLNAIGSGKFRDSHDDLQQLIGVWGHRFNARFHMQTEAYYMWEYDAYTGGTVINGPARSFAGSGRGTFLPGRSDEWGIVNYFGYKVGENDSITLRTEFFDDIKGQRTGYATLYNSETLGWEHTFAPGVVFRPEMQWDHSGQAHAFNDGLRKNQITFATDLIVSF